MNAAAELIRMGATMLSQPCPQCGGIQVRYKGKVYCTQHEDISTVPTVNELSFDAIAQSARQVILRRVEEATTTLQSEKDLAKQMQIVEFVAKCVDLLQKIPEPEDRT